LEGQKFHSMENLCNVLSLVIKFQKIQSRRGKM
jgi:hypothetical protein